MRTTLWVAHRSPVTWTFLLLCLGVGAASGLTAALSRAGAWDAGLDNARFISAVAVPLLVAAHWGQLNDVDAEAFRTGLGGNADQQRTRELLAIALIVAEGLAICTVLPGLLMNVQPEPGLSPVDLPSSAVYTALTAATAVLFTTAVAMRNKSSAAIARGAAIAICYVMIYFGPIPGRLGLLAILPVTAPGAIVRGAESDGSTLVALGAASIAVAMWAGLHILRSPTRPRPGRSRFSATQQGRVQRGSLAGLAVTVFALATIAGAVLPLAAQTWLPTDLRPSLALQRLDDRGPEQVAQKFFRTYRQGEAAAAGTLTVNGNSTQLMRDIPGEVLLANDGSYDIVRSDDLQHAYVSAQVGSVRVCFGMQFETADDDRWRVSAVDLDEC